MDLRKDIETDLLEVKINPASLSKNEIKIITQIKDFFVDFEEKDSQYRKALNDNKFNKSIVATKVDCSRQTLYENPIITIYLDHLLKKANKITNYTKDDVVSKDKYNRLKNENEKLMLNIVDISVMDSEVVRLAEEIKSKNNRIDKLIQRIEKQNKEILELKKKTLA